MLEHGSDATELATVLAATTMPRTEQASFGRVFGGSITLRGFLKRGRLFRPSFLRKIRDNPSTELWLRRRDFTSSPDRDWVLAASLTSSSTGVPGGTLYDKAIGRLQRDLRLEKRWAHIYLDDKHPARSMAPIDLAYLFLIRADRRPDGGLDDLGLVLQAWGGDAGVKYERLGIFIMQTSNRGRCFGSDTHVVEIL